MANVEWRKQVTVNRCASFIGWQQNALRGNVFPPPNRFAGPNIDNSPMNCWAQRPMSDTGMQPPMPPAAIPPPQRSRLQNVWSANVNTPVSGMYLPPPPTVDYNVCCKTAELLSSSFYCRGLRIRQSCTVERRTCDCRDNFFAA